MSGKYLAILLVSGGTITGLGFLMAYVGGFGPCGPPNIAGWISLVVLTPAGLIRLLCPPQLDDWLREPPLWLTVALWAIMVIWLTFFWAFVTHMILWLRQRLF
jgi:hypothetical protein